ncbi:MAG: TonB-dependent receptor, partial [Gammaproteobacteria bacterium]|nr:TonB-dependent receptor [Gammaproteobacteria bacterium]
RWDKQSYIATVENEQTSPRFSLRYQAADKTVLRAGWGRFSQAQGVNELQVEDGITRFFPAQRSTQAVLGIDHQFANDLQLRVELYSKKMDSLRPRFENLFNQLELLPELGSDRRVLTPDDATAQGAELLIRMNRPDRALNWWAGASFSSVKDNFAGTEVPRSWDQKAAVNVGVNWRRGNWRADAVAQYHDGWPTTDVFVVNSGGVSSVELGQRNAARLPDYFSLDFRLSHRQMLRGSSAWTWFFELSNATSRENRCCVDYSIDENDDGSLSVTREYDNWLPIIPSLGVIWEF